MKRTFYPLLVLCVLVINSFAQPGSNDPTFNPMDIGFGNGDGSNSNISSAALQPNGKIIIGGDFTTYNGIAKNRIVRLNADGSLDMSFNQGTGANSNIFTIVLQPDGKIIIGGDFTSYNGIIRNRIARLNADGSLDPVFNPGTGVNSTIYTAALQSNGQIIIGGSFTSYNSTTINRIARLNADGSLDPVFNPGTGANITIETASLQIDGKIIIGGQFTSYNSITRNRIARLNADGSLDSAFNPGTGANNAIKIATLQPDGKIIIGGQFTSYNSIVRNRIARLNADGSHDAGFNPGTGANNLIKTASLQPDGKMVIVGEFTSYNGTARNCIARLNADGSFDNVFNPGNGANNWINIAPLQPDGKIIIGGNFTSYNGTARNRIARVNADGSHDVGFNSGTGSNSNIFAIALQPDGKIIIGGDFALYNGITRNCIARLNADGSLDNGFDPGTGANNPVNSATLQPDGKIIIGGDFTSYNGTAKFRIARLNADGSLDTSFNPSGANAGVFTTTLQPDGKIIIGGDFTSYNGTPRNRIARLNADGSIDTSFNPGTGTNAGISTVALQNDGKIIIGGGFTSFNSIGSGRIARLNADGSLDTGFNLAGANNWVKTAALQPDGKIIIGGEFTIYNGTPRTRIARLNTNGSLDASFIPLFGANWTIRTAALQPDGKIIIVGEFNAYNSIARNSIARLNADGSLDVGFDPGTGANSWGYTAALQPDGKIIIGGAFTSYNGIGRNRIARINGACVTSTSNTTSASSCDSHTWAVNGQTYTTSGTYNHVTGCHTEVLILTITNSTTDTTTVASCDNYTWALNGQTYTTSGTYNHITGCDTEVLILTITNSTTDTTTAVSCDNYTWAVNGQNYTTSGTYTHVTGCDSKILVLTINSVSSISTSLLGTIITANNNNASYQWLDCSSGYLPISGATSQSYTATSNGTYAVELTENGCVDTSACLAITTLSISENSLVSKLLIFPNPTYSKIHITLPELLLGQTILITNALGQVLHSSIINSTSTECDLTKFTDGIYFIQVQTNDGIISKKIVKN